MEITYIAFFIAWMALSYNYPRFFAIALSAIFPLYLLKFNFYGIPFTIVEWFVYATAIAFIIRFYKDIFKWAGNFFDKGIFRRIDIWVILFFISALIAAILTPLDGKNHAFGILKGWIFVPIVYFYIVKKTIKNLSDGRRIIDAYAFSAVILGVWAIYQYLHGFLIDARATGPFLSANYLAFFLAPAFVYSAVSAWQNIQTIELPWWKKVFIKLFRKEVEQTNLALFFIYFTFALITGFALIISNSYGAFLGVITAFIFYGVYYYFFSPWKQPLDSSIKKISVIVVVLITIFGIIVPKYDRWKFDSVVNFKGTTSSAIRLEIWQIGLKMLSKNPVFGIGLGRFQNEYRMRGKELLGRDPIRPDSLHSHNLLIETWLNLGILGLIIFLVLVFKLFVLLGASMNDMRKRFIVLLCAMMLVIVVHGFFDVVFWKNDLALQFWMIMGCAFALAKK